MVARAASILPCITGLLKCLYAGWCEYTKAVEDESIPLGKNGNYISTIKEITLAAAWTAGAGYQCFRFTDSLMTRWLVHYTPIATLVRLISICGIIAYFISGLYYFLGVESDARMLLPAWIITSSTIGAGFHIVRHRISGYRELSTSITVFAGLSFLSTMVLLQDSHSKRDKPPWKDWYDWILDIIFLWWDRMNAGHATAKKEL